MRNLTNVYPPRMSRLSHVRLEGLCISGGWVADKKATTSLSYTSCLFFFMLMVWKEWKKIQRVWKNGRRDRHGNYRRGTGWKWRNPPLDGAAEMRLEIKGHRSPRGKSKIGRRCDVAKEKRRSGSYNR